MAAALAAPLRGAQLQGAKRLKQAALRASRAMASTAAMTGAGCAGSKAPPHPKTHLPPIRDDRMDERDRDPKNAARGRIHAGTIPSAPSVARSRQLASTAAERGGGLSPWWVQSEAQVRSSSYARAGIIHVDRRPPLAAPVSRNTARPPCPLSTTSGSCIWRVSWPTMTVRPSGIRLTHAYVRMG